MASKGKAAKISVDQQQHSLRFHLTKKGHGGDLCKQGDGHTGCILRPTNVNTEYANKYKSLEQERHFACVKKPNGSYECLEMKMDDYYKR